MRIKKHLTKNDNYYEYSSNYIRKYIIIILVILFISFFVLCFIFFNYRIIPEKSNMKNNTPILNLGSVTITNERGIFYTGDFIDIPKSIDINDKMTENLNIYLLHDNNVIFWKFYKYGFKRYFLYNAFNIIDGHSQNIIFKEEEKNFLDFYDNFIRIQFKKSIGQLNLEIPNFYNQRIYLKSEITNLINTEFSFKFTNFNASMVNWSKNRASYIAFYYGLPSGHLVLPGSEVVINNNSSVIAVNTVGRIPSRYSHNLIVALTYTSYTTEPISIFIYNSKPASQNSKMIKILFKNEWYVYKNFYLHEYKDTIDFYSKDDGFSFLFTITSECICDSFGLFSKMDLEIIQGVLNGYFTIDNNLYQINGNAIREFVHNVF